MFNYWTPNKLTLNNTVPEENVKTFSDKLLLVVNQPNEEELDEIIKEELRNEFDDTDIKHVYSHFMIEIFDWMKAKDGTFRTQICIKEIFEKIRKEICGAVIFDVKAPVKTFSGRKQELDELFNMIGSGFGKMYVLSQIKSISGLGGIGKTELARQYIQKLMKKDPNISILWINAENEVTLERSFRSLAKDNRIRISTVDVDGTKKHINTIVNEIYRYFSKRESLFVFDNADRGNSLESFLPLHISTINAKKPNILITSRIAREYWKQYGIEYGITLNVFTNEESVNFVKEALQITDSSKDNHIQELAVDILHNFPLALQQAVSYIIEQNNWLQRNRNSFYSINNYITDFEVKKKVLLNYDVYNNIDNDYTKTTFTTWKITLDKIRNNEKYGQLALDVLYSMAYIAPNNIPVSLFSNIDEIKENDYEKALDLLNRYSMVKLKQGKVDVHALVQDVTRLELQQQNKEEKVLKITSDILNRRHRQNDIEEYNKTKEVLPHLEVFLTYKDKFESRDINKLLQEIHYAHCIIGNPKRQKEVLEDILEIQINNYFLNKNISAKKSLNILQKEISDNEKNKVKRFSSIFKAINILETHNNKDICCAEICVTLHHLSNAYAALGKYEVQKELLEKTLPVLDQINDKIIYALILHNLGNCYGEYGNYKQKKNLLTTALSILEQNYGKENIKVASVLDDLGSAYGALGNFFQQKDFQERALKIKENLYGRKHIALATTQSNLGNAYGALQDYEKQRELQEEALLIKEQHYGYDHIEIAVTLDSLSSVYETLSDYKTQIEILERALEIKLKHYGSGHIKVANTLYYLGRAYVGLGRYEKQIELHEMALSIIKKHYGEDHIFISSILIDLGVAYGVQNNYKKQKDLFEKALGIQLKESHYKNNIKIAMTKFILGNAYGNLEDYERQIELQESALKINCNELGPENLDRSVILNALGNAYGSINNYLKQKYLQEEALEIQMKHFGDELNLEIVKTINNLSIAYKILKKYEKQIEIQEKALNILENLGSDKIKIALLLEDLGNAYGNLGNFNKQIIYLEKAVPNLESHYNKKELANTLYQLGIAYGKSENYEKQKDLLKRTLEIQTNYVEDIMDLPIAHTMFWLGNANGAIGDYNSQKFLQECSLPTLEIHYGRGSTVIGQMLINLGTAYQNLNDNSNQIIVHEKALSILDKNCDHNENIVIAGLLTNLGNAYGSSGNYIRQRELQERALPILKKYYGDQHINVGIILHNLGNAYHSLGNFDKQIKLQEEALKIEENEYGNDDYKLIDILCSLAEGYKNKGETQKQINILERVLLIEKKYYGENSMKIIKTLNKFEKIYSNLNDQINRIRVLENILSIEEKEQNPKNEIYLGHTLHVLGNAYGFYGNYSKQIKYQEEALVILDKYGDKGTNLVLLLQNLSTAYDAIGDFQRQKDIFKKLLFLKIKEHGENHKEVARVLQNLGNVYHKLEEREKQLKVLERALHVLKQNNNCEGEIMSILQKLSNVSRILGDYDKYIKFRKEMFAIDKNCEELCNLHT